MKPLIVFLLGLTGLAGLAWFLTVQPILFAGERVQVPAVSAEALERHVRALALELPPRGPDPDNMAVAADYIAGALAAAGAGPVREQRFEVDGAPFRNVILDLGPDTPERIVVGAHYDTDSGLPGADDNASGVAGLIELARLLAGAPLSVRVELVAFALEEMPFFGTDQMGSAVHAASLKAQGRDVRLMISLEMLGYFDDAPGSQGYPYPVLRLFYPDAAEFIAVVGNLGQMGVVRRMKRAMRAATPLPVHSINAPAWVPGIDLSDQFSYWQEGYPAVMITDTAFYRNPHYHTATDTPERLDYRRMARVVQGVYAAVVDFAN